MTAETRAFCPRCGDPIEGDREPLSVAGPRDRDEVLCDDCYLQDFELVDAPERVTVRVCARCGAIHKGNRWVDVGADDYTDVAIEAVSEALAVHVKAEDVAWQVEPEQVDANTIRMHCYFTGTVRGRPVEAEVVVPVTISRETCTRCGRIAGDYYASTVQLRARDRTPTREEIDRTVAVAHEVVDDMIETGDRNAFVTDVTETPDGVDVKVSTTKIGGKISRRVVEEFGGSVSSAETLVTEDADGNEVYRVTYAVRLPPFAAGDVIQPDDEGPVLVTSVRGNLKGRRLTTGDSYEASFEDGDAPDAERLGHVDDATETTLVSVEDAYAVQVLDPETFETKTIARPDYLDPDAGQVRVFKGGDGLYVVPDDV